jgi:photosystem II stability/assembly factor-like uncharacterized protein
VLAQNSTWLSIYPTPQGERLTAIEVLDSNTYIAIGGSGTVMKTTNGGESWSVHHFTENVRGNLNGISFSGTTGMIAGGGGVILKTSDVGQSWSLLNTGVSILFNDIILTSNSTAIAVGGGSSDLILRTTNSG